MESMDSHYLLSYTIRCSMAIFREVADLPGLFTKSSHNVAQLPTGWSPSMGEVQRQIKELHCLCLNREKIEMTPEVNIESPTSVSAGCYLYAHAFFVFFFSFLYIFSLICFAKCIL